MRFPNDEQLQVLSSVEMPQPAPRPMGPLLGPGPKSDGPYMPGSPLNPLRPPVAPGQPGSATGPTPNIGGMPGAIMKKGGKVAAKAPVKKAVGGKVAAKPVAKKAGGKVAAKPMGKPVMKKAGGRVAAKPMAKGRKK